MQTEMNNRKLFTHRCVLIRRKDFQMFSYFVSNVSSVSYAKDSEILQVKDVTYFVFQIREKSQGGDLLVYFM
jgi:hypothetical protein